MFWPNLEKIDSSIVLYYVLYKISPYFEQIISYIYILINQMVYKHFNYQTNIATDYLFMLEMILGVDYEKYKYPGTYLIKYKNKYHSLNHSKSVSLDRTWFYVNLTTISLYSVYNTIETEHFDYINSKLVKDEWLYVPSCNGSPIVDGTGKLQYCISPFSRIEKRDWKNTIISDTNKKSIEKYIKNFINNDGHYSKFNISKKMCMIFYGRPGMGKTSIIKTLASEYKYNLIYTNINSLSDELLPYLYKSVPKNSFVIFEDIDCAFSNRTETHDETKKLGINVYNTNKKVTLSGFLNALDGLSSNNGIITILTTNFIDKLDDALIRKGRVDLRIELTPSPDLYGQMYDRFFEDNAHREKFITHCTKNDFCLADAQDLCLQNLSNQEFSFFVCFVF